jgi:hypothetical protein
MPFFIVARRSWLPGNAWRFAFARAVRRIIPQKCASSEDFIVFGDGLFDVLDLQNVRRPVTGIDGGFHTIGELPVTRGTVDSLNRHGFDVYKFEQAVAAELAAVAR